MKVLREMRRFPLAVQLLLVNQLGVNTGFYLLIPYLATHLTENLGMSAAVVGVVLGVRNLSQQGLFIIGGSASDRLGARGVIIAGCALRTVGFALFALGDSLAVLLAASVLSGLAGALFNPAVRTYIAQEADERKAEAFALFNVFATTGALIGPLLGSALLLVDFRTSALTAAGIFAVLTVAQALVLPAREKPEPSKGVFSPTGVKSSATAPSWPSPLPWSACSPWRTSSTCCCPREPGRRPAGRARRGSSSSSARCPTSCSSCGSHARSSPVATGPVG